MLSQTDELLTNVIIPMPLVAEANAAFFDMMYPQITVRPILSVGTNAAQCQYRYSPVRDLCGVPL